MLVTHDPEQTLGGQLRALQNRQSIGPEQAAVLNVGDAQVRVRLAEQLHHSVCLVEPSGQGKTGRRNAQHRSEQRLVPDGAFGIRWHEYEI